MYSSSVQSNSNSNTVSVSHNTAQYSILVHTYCNSSSSSVLYCTVLYCTVLYTNATNAMLYYMYMYGSSVQSNSNISTVSQYSTV